MPGRPMKCEIKVTYREDSRKLDRTFEFLSETTCRQAVEQVCSAFALHSDWTMAMYSRKHGGWIHDDTRLVDIEFKGQSVPQKTLELRKKTSSFFEVSPCTYLEQSKVGSIRNPVDSTSPTPNANQGWCISTVCIYKTSLRDSGILRGPSSPIDHHRLFNFFRSSDDHPQHQMLVSKFQNGSIYLSVIILNSDGKILLSPAGLPPTIMVSTVDRGNYYNFDTESADFAWMFKTTLDWSSEKVEMAPSTSMSLLQTLSSSPPSSSSSSARQRRYSSDAASLLSQMEMKPFTPSDTKPSTTLSPQASTRKSLSINRAGSPNLLIPNRNALTSSISSVSMDRASVLSDTSGNTGTPLASSTVTPSLAAGRQSFQYKDRQNDYRRENSLRQEYVAAVERLQRRLGIAPIDLLHNRVMDLPQVGAKCIMAIQYVKDNQRDQIAQELLHMGSFRWRHVESVSNSIYTRKEPIWSELVSYYDSVRVSRPTSGLYIGLYYTESTMAGLQILVPRNRRTFMPLVKVREDANLSKEEWTWMQSTTNMDLNQLAKNCAVPKEDPLHHLKVEFAHSTAKLSRLTQLKWNPSDIYTVDTMKVVVQDEDVEAEDGSTETANSGHGWGQGLAAMSQDPIWKEFLNTDDGSLRQQPGVQDSNQGSKGRRMNSLRVIMFIKPTRHATQPQEHFNRQLFELCPFNLFDALHHSVFNASMYHQLRKTMLQVTNDIGDLELEIEMDIEEDLQRSRRCSVGSGHHYNDSMDNNRMIGSLLIDKLGIKGEPEINGPGSFRQQGQDPRHRSSFIGDIAIHGLGSASGSNRRRDSSASTHSLLEAIERSTTTAPSVSSVLSLASTLSSLSNETYATVPPIPDSHERRSDVGLSDQAPMGSSFSTRSFSTSSSGSSSSSFAAEWSQANMTLAKPMALLAYEQEQLSNAFTERSRSRSGPRLCLDDFETTPVFSRSSSSNNLLCLEVNDNHPSVVAGPSPIPPQAAPILPPVLPLQRHKSVNLRVENLPPLSPPPNAARHRRSHSHIQGFEWGSNGSNSISGGGNGLPLSSPPPPASSAQERSRATSHSSAGSISHPSCHPLSSSYRGSRHLSASSRASSPFAPSQPCHHHQSAAQQMACSCQQQQLQRLQHPCSPELERLSQQQQAFQEQWRLISWTRQLNEWDHARMLRTQEDLFGSSLNFGVNVTSGTNIPSSPLVIPATPVSETTPNTIVPSTAPTSSN
ncbi:hypothetical protein EMPS_03038 [Entomortierella parvispora]|uniref:Ras-associating domain-containing protein n=1 Tax=Entomortierella parvispora TaxID=205924 RepID=A0A9P3LU55_9FUNG|nr:hypothetical protein EMPS_03038 [Entomortierella parvispora]